MPISSSTSCPSGPRPHRHPSPAIRAEQGTSEPAAARVRAEHGDAGHGGCRAVSSNRCRRRRRYRSRGRRRAGFPCRRAPGWRACPAGRARAARVRLSGASSSIWSRTDSTAIAGALKGVVSAPGCRPARPPAPGRTRRPQRRRRGRSLGQGEHPRRDRGVPHVVARADDDGGGSPDRRTREQGGARAVTDHRANPRRAIVANATGSDRRPRWRPASPGCLRGNQRSGAGIGAEDHDARPRQVLRHQACQLVPEQRGDTAGGHNRSHEGGDPQLPRSACAVGEVEVEREKTEGPVGGLGP